MRDEEIPGVEAAGDAPHDGIAEPWVLRSARGEQQLVRDLPDSLDQNRRLSLRDRLLYRFELEEISNDAQMV
jgi:hypothetical protein